VSCFLVVANMQTGPPLMARICRRALRTCDSTSPPNSPGRIGLLSERSARLSNPQVETTACALCVVHGTKRALFVRKQDTNLVTLLGT